MTSIVAALSLLLVLSASSPANALSLNHYDKTCPDVELIVAKAVKSATMKDKTVPAALLRMHFHDCFIRGCDASVLLYSKGNNKAEKDGPANLSLHGFFVIENAKKEVEASCPGVVSCADILAFAARDAVVLSGGPTWDVPRAEKMGGHPRLAKPYNCLLQPSTYPNCNKASLREACPWMTLQLFQEEKGLQCSMLTSNASAGGHTMGFSHCSSFQNRIRNFNATHDIDPTMHPSFAASLRSVCPIKKRAKNAGATMDPSSTTFDNTYYKLIIQGKTLFSSDQALLSNPKTKGLVYKFASSKEAFEKAFVNSMIKMSSLNGGQEIRKDCRVVN